MISRFQDDNGAISLDGLGRRRGLSFSLSSAPRRAQTNVRGVRGVGGGLSVKRVSMG